MGDKERLEKFEKALEELKERYEREKRWQTHLGEYGDKNAYLILESVLVEFRF